MPNFSTPKVLDTHFTVHAVRYRYCYNCDRHCAVLPSSGRFSTNEQ
jgi:hypothetical protein